MAEEEPNVISVALRPGMVDTDVSPEFVALLCESHPDFYDHQMQAEIRAIGATALAPADYQKFCQAYSSGKLVKPEDCGHVIAALALRADKSLSGEFVSWDSDECKAYRKEEGQA